MSDSPVDYVSLDIDYAIIEHFSMHLYGSPNKAVEELVANSFDAFATWVQVFFASEYAPDKIIVWDNGESMDVPGLKGLWKIAQSPKQKVADRIVRRSDGSQRKLIGKFGIGKLASYTLGNKILHVCRRTDEFLLVEIDYSAIIQSIHPIGDESGKVNFTAPIRKLTEDEARRFVYGEFEQPPLTFEELFNEKNWTFALISNLKHNDLTAGRLRWVLGNAMPLRPDFNLWVNSVEVLSKLDREGPLASWTMASPDMQEAMKKEWNDAVKKKDVSGDISFGVEAGLNPASPTTHVPFVNFPNLGKVWGTIRLYENSLDLMKSDEQGRSYGFFIMVRERLINADDDKLMLDDPSFGTFYRSQYVLHIDGLDQDLLADRDRFARNTPRTAELIILQNCVYHVTRTKQTNIDAKAAEAASPAHRLPVFSR